MSAATHRARLKTILDAVTGVGQTHDYKRWAVKWGDFLDLFKSSGQVRGFEITYGGFTATKPYLGRRAKVLRVHQWRIDGYLGLDDSDATEKTLAGLGEDVYEAIDADATLQADALTVEVSPAQLVMDHRRFGSVLCNHVTITTETSEWYDPAS